MPIQNWKKELGTSENLRQGSFRLLVGQLCLFCLFAMTMTACASPQVSALSPTPIPTLIPATMVPRQLEPAETERLDIESFPAGNPAAAAGQGLYAEHCVECHGADGNGQVPNARNFSDVDYMRGETPLDFYVAITEGAASFEDAENEMPAFGDVLSSDERWDLVYYVWRFATSFFNDTATTEIYTSFCEECHGDDGRSQVLDAADLSDQRFIAAQSPSTLYLSVTRGRGSMPAWQARLIQDERWMVIEYLRTFSYDPLVIVESEETVLVEEPVEEEEPAACEPAVLAQTNPFEWNDAQAVAAGETIYQRECSECHGEDGTGEIRQAHDFTNPVVRGRLLENPGEHLCIVTEGLNRMPDFKDTLSEEEMWQALTYIASLGE
jgi:mono/diheme cytochrome c family protein